MPVPRRSSRARAKWSSAFMPGQNNLLEDLPAELLELVVLYLDVGDIRRLRLTDRDLSAKVSQGRFKSFFWEKKILINGERRLRKFVEVTRGGWMGNELKELTIAVEAKDRVVGGAEILVGEVFSNLWQFSKWKDSDSLTLRIEGTVEGLLPFPQNGAPRWRKIWEVAGAMFEEVMRALETSKIPVRRLDLFGDVPRCALGIDRFADGIKGLELRHLEELAICLSEGSCQDIKAVSRFLQQSPLLRCLKLRWVKTRTEQPPSEEQVFPKDLIRGINFPSLRDCTLTGLVHLEASDLVSFLNAVRLERLTLSDINLQDGGWQEVFDQIVATQNKLESVSLQNLYEEVLVCFDEPDELAFPFSEPNGPISLRREGETSRNPVRFQLKRGRALDSGAFARWRHQKTLRVGPPDV